MMDRLVMNAGNGGAGRTGTEPVGMVVGRADRGAVTSIQYNIKTIPVKTTQNPA